VIESLAYIGFRSPNAEDWAEFGPGILGLEDAGRGPDGALRFRNDDAAWRIALHPGDADDLAYLGWLVAGPAALTDAVVRLEKQGLQVQRGDAALAALRSVAELAWFVDPFGFRHELAWGLTMRPSSFRPGRALSGFVTGAGGLGHAVLIVPDLQQAERFYTEGLGFGLSDRVEMGMSVRFLHCNRRHHTLAFAAVPGLVGMHHLMLEVASLDDVGTALINTQKIKLEKTFAELTYTELAQYCYRDSEIAYKLTSFEDDSAMKLILVLARISSMPMEDVSRQGVSRWIRNFMHREHRHRNMLIPNSEDILTRKGKTSTTAIIKGKKYKGAIVVEPTPGVHFNVAVMDFPSLYPSIIKVWNLGYQSILCPHPECRSNLIPGTPHWVCTKKRALESLLIGSLRDLRVRWYKQRSKDKTLPTELRSWYNITQGALKVILNASYGVFGADSFDLYCPPVAEATAAIGRHSITQILNHAEAIGIQVLYGDTDSLFLKNPTKEQVENLAHWTEHELKMSIDVDKVYRYAVFSSRKKNYLGVLEDGTVDVKGLTGKKKHIPNFIKNSFNDMKERLAKVKNPAEFEKAKKDIAEIVRERYTTLKRREWESSSELAFHVVLGEELEHYTKTTPQHVKAAKLLEKTGIELRAGDLISFVKVIREPHVKPVELASKNEIDVDKYIAYLHSTFDQVLDALGLSFDEIIGLTKLERFLG